jgi:glycosyltransferase involved in cell wall biosynthesis
MRLTLAMTTYNEIEYGPHIEMQLNDALEIDYDDIVILDDGSDDGTWDVLEDYNSKYKHIHIFKNNNNSVRAKGQNRWLSLTQKCAEYSPDWICIRAADMLYSAPLKRDLRKVIKEYSGKGFNKLRFPLIHLWRSDWWYRTDNIWGESVVSLFWKFNKNFGFLGNRDKAIDHQGAHIPDIINGRKPILKEIRSREKSEFKYTILHYGHTTHRKKEVKFVDMMDRAIKGRTQNMPPPSKMPPVKKWLDYNGYRGFWEFGLKLKKVPQLWFDKPVPDVPRPKIESFYEIIKQYNEERAEEYKKLLTKTGV